MKIKWGAFIAEHPSSPSSNAVSSRFFLFYPLSLNHLRTSILDSTGFIGRQFHPILYESPDFLRSADFLFLGYGIIRELQGMIIQES